MKYLNFYIALILVVAAVGCDVLSQDPQTAISEDIAIHDQKSAEAALNGLYSELQSGDYYGSEIQVMSDVSSDVSQSVGTWDFYREMDTYVTVPGNLENKNLWSQIYATINHANNIIAKVPGLEKTPQAKKDQILGETYFIRALAFFDATRTFGGVPGRAGTMGIPIVTKPSRQIDDDSFPKRASIEDSYAQVESDLKEAESRLSGFSNPNRVSEPAVKALLSRLYLYLRDYDQTEKYATDVINNYSFKLVPNYVDIFRNKNTSEAIFDLAFNTTDGNSMENWYYPSNKGGRGDEISLHTDFAEMVLARKNDDRGKLIAFDADNGVYYPTKYDSPGNDDNLQIIRFAEMYLNRAEARAQKDTPDLAGALADLNAIRNRAGLKDTTITGVDKTQKILGAIAHERAIEFMEEGQRWYDLVRTGQALNVLKNLPRVNGSPVTLTDKGRLVFPIPTADMDANKNLDQNEAYK